MTMFVAAPASACPALDARMEPLAVADLSIDGDLRLADGTRLKLAGLRFDDMDETMRRGAFADLSALVPESLVEGVIEGEPDRWGRRTVQLRLIDADGGVIWAQERLLAAGAALYWPDGVTIDPCHAEATAAEASARRGKKGLWATGGPLIDPLTVDLATLTGRLLMFRATVDAVVARRGFLYINFGRNWRGRLSVVAPLPKDRQARSALADALLALPGKRVLVRGFIEPGRMAPRLLVRSASQISLDEEKAGE